MFLNKNTLVKEETFCRQNDLPTNHIMDSFFEVIPYKNKKHPD